MRGKERIEERVQIRASTIHCPSRKKQYIGKEAQFKHPVIIVANLGELTLGKALCLPHSIKFLQKPQWDYQGLQFTDVGILQ